MIEPLRQRAALIPAAAAHVHFKIGAGIDVPVVHLLDLAVIATELGAHQALEVVVAVSVEKLSKAQKHHRSPFFGPIRRPFVALHNYPYNGPAQPDVDEKKGLRVMQLLHGSR